jgi:hypothetical protein
VDFVERGFRRFCKTNGAGAAKKIWRGFLRIMDHPFELTEQERNSAEIESPTTTLHLVGEYDAAASIPIRAALTHLERNTSFFLQRFTKSWFTISGNGCVSTITATPLSTPRW